MDLEKGFLGGFLVLGFVLFVVGFLTGMLALSLLRVALDFSTTGIMIFVLGFIAGMVTIALVSVMLKLSKLQKNA
jgi:hypothetical protein